MAEPVSIGQFEQLVMTAVLALGDNAYGVTIHGKVSELIAPKSVTLGAVYATLDRLEAKGLVTSNRQSLAADAPSRRIFAVTAAGGRSLSLTRNTRDRLWKGVNVGALSET